MFLSKTERQEVRKVASSYNIYGEPEELVTQAIEAMTTTEDEAALKVAEAAGVGFICDGMVWYRKEKRNVALDAQIARAIITQAKSDETYEGPIPEDDAKAISEAESLVKMAEAAWEQYVRGPEVEAILRIAAGENGDAPAADSEPAEPEPDPGPEPTPDPEPDPAPEPQADPPAEPQETGFSLSPEEMSKTEPWEGYADEKVPDIVEAIEIGVEEDDNPGELLAHIWAYESAHKDRKRIIKRLDEAAKQLSGGNDETPATEEKPPPEAGGETPTPSGEDQEPDNAAAAQGDSAGDPQAEPGAGESGGDEGAATGDHDEDRAGGGATAAADPDPEPEPAGEAAEPAREGKADEDKPRAESSDPVYDELIADVEAELGEQRLHVPPPLPPGEQPDLPFDLTTLSDKELQQFHGYFTAYVYRTNHLLMREEAKARKCKDAAEELARDLLVAAEKYDEHDKAKTMTILEAEVESDPEVIKWRKRQRKHDTFATSYRSERDSYLRVVEALSRQESMRQNEWERGGGRSGKR